MDYVHYQEVTSCGDLDLDAEAYGCAVGLVALDPIDSAGLRLGPAGGFSESAVKDRTKRGSAVRILLLSDSKVKGCQYAVKLIEQGG